MAQLTGAAQPVALGGGYFVRAPGVRGQADLSQPRPAGERARSRAVDDGTEALDAAFAEAHVTEVRRIDLSVQPRGPAAPAPALRSVDGRQDALEAIVPDLDPRSGSSCSPATRRAC